MSDSCIVAITAQAAFLVSGLIPRRACSHFARQRGKILDDIG